MVSGKNLGVTLFFTVIVFTRDTIFSLELTLYLTQIALLLTQKTLHLTEITTS